MLKILDINKALSDENRIRALIMLKKGELCVCQIINMIGLAPSTVSKHMSILKQAGLVETRKDGRWIYYRLVNAKNSAAFDITQWLDKYLKNDTKIVQDNRKLEVIKRSNNYDISQCYRSADKTKYTGKSK